MKISQQLSTYQKQQYTVYLETQLEKFSSFMLTYKKDNERTKNLQDVIQKMNGHIGQLNQRIKMLEFYQKQNFKQCQAIQNSSCRTVELEHRLKKVQSMYFERPIQDRNKQNNFRNANNCKSTREVQDLEDYIENISKETNKKIKKIQKDVQSLFVLYERDTPTVDLRAHVVKSRQSEPVMTNYSQVNSAQNSNYPHTQSVTKGELKATEHKIFDVFDRKFSKIQKMIRKSLKRPSTSANKSLNSEKPNSENMFIKEQTFAVDFQGQTNRSKKDFHKNKQIFDPYQEQAHDDYEIAMSHVKNSMNQKSYSISESSQRLKPVTHATHQTIQFNSTKSSKVKKQKRNKKQRSVSRSLSKSAKSVSANSISKSKSKSKSISVSVSKSKSKSKSRKKVPIKLPEKGKVSEFYHKNCTVSGSPSPSPCSKTNKNDQQKQRKSNKEGTQPKPTKHSSQQSKKLK